VIQGIEQLFDSAEAYRLIGWLKELLGETDQAIAWTIKARNLEPANSDHTSKLAELYASIGYFETALMLEPEPGIGLLFNMRRYHDLIDIAEYLMIEEPGDMDARYLLAFAYNATGQFESAIHVLSATGLPDIVLNDTVRSISDFEGFYTLVNALAGTGQLETREMANSLALWSNDKPWWGDVGWIGLFRGCGLAILGRHEEALQDLSHIKESHRLRRAPFLQNSWCFQQYADEPIYQDVLRDQEDRKAALRERLPATLVEFGVTL
jgi:tetratricopeptide (TPR) repeat protein